MYKVVTHSIKEEHFTHPVTAHAGMQIHNGGIRPLKHAPNVAPNSSPMISSSISPTTPTPTPNMLIISRDSHNVAEYCGNITPLNVVSPWNSWGLYDAYGDLGLHGNVTIGGAMIGTKPKVVIFDIDPSSSSFAGNVGDMGVGSRHVYLCVSQDKWARWEIQKSW